ncbi:MAG: hypothetical protein C0596_17610 [Marinilabiliales bacterium]|nr:MAG: hypothetical protein C0596_17610 [Marinilabiliales bacterium]
MKPIYTILFIFLLIGLISSCNNEEKQVEEVELPYSVVKKIHRDELLDLNKDIVEIDHTVIEKFIERRKWEMEISGTGLYYQIYEKTDGQQAVDGKVAEFSYTTMMLNGDVLYSSEVSGNRMMHLGHNQEEIGLNEGLMMMKEGEKGRFILPPHLAFGVPGDGYLVPPYTILVYDIELVKLHNKVD